MTSWEASQLQLLVEDALGVKLTARDRQLLSHRLGWGGHRALTQIETAKAMGTHQPVVSQTERSLKSRLKWASSRRKKDQQALEAQRLTLVRMYQLVVSQAEQLGLTMQELATRAVPVDEAHPAA